MSDQPLRRCLECEELFTDHDDSRGDCPFCESVNTERFE